MHGDGNVSDYRLLNQEIESESDGTRAAALHGYCLGALCVGAGDLWAGFAEEYLPGEPIAPTAAFADALQSLLAASAGALEAGQFELELMLPDDHAPIELRVAAVAAWAEAFLRGLAQTQVDLTLSAVAEESLEDLQAISELDDAAGDEDEAALAEVIEHVRLAACQIYVDTQAARGAAAAGDFEDEG